MIYCFILLQVFNMMKSAFTVHVHMVDIFVRVAQTSGLPLANGFDANVNFCWLLGLELDVDTPLYSDNVCTTGNGEHHMPRHHCPGAS